VKSVLLTFHVSHVDNLLPCRGLLWVVVANLLLQEHMLAMDPFLLHNLVQLLGAFNGSSIYLPLTLASKCLPITLPQ